jgi:signal peptide peptidase SppA
MTTKSYVLQAFVETPWAILPNKLAVLEEIVARHVAGEKLSAEEIETRVHGAARPADRRVNSVAILPLFGTIFPRANLMTDMSGATSAERFGTQFDQMLKDPNVGAIVIDVDSPGGQVSGIEELSKKIFDARGQKPIIAVADHLMASAAYWIGTAADEVVVSPSADVGSIGVFAVHQDVSVALEQSGIKVSLISDGKFKTEANPYQPLSEEARAAIQARVSDAYDAFVGAVARNRGVNPAAVRGGFGEGRVVGAQEAVNLGMADRVATLEETINKLLGQNVPVASYSAADTDPSEVAQEPSSDQTAMQEARARLALVGNKPVEGDSKMLRNLLKARDEKLTRANQIVETADSEERDLNDAERAEFAQLLGEGDSTGEIGALDARIEKIQGEREKLRAAAAKKFSAPASAGIEKPDGKGSNVMKRADFNNLDPAGQAAFVKHGGKIED